MTSYIYNMVDTWNNGATTFTAVKMDVTDTASNAASLLMDLQVGSASKFKIAKNGNAVIGSGNGSETAPVISFGAAPSYGFYLTGGAISVSISGSEFLRFDGANGLVNSTIWPFSIQGDVFWSRRGAANWRLGKSDAAAPVAQTLSVQSVVAGTSNTAGTNLTITGSQGTGTGAGGSIIFQVAPAGSTGTAQNALATALQVNGNGGITGQDGATANTLALRNGTTAQAFRVYNTFTDATTFERANIFWDSNVLKISAQKGSVGGTARDIQFETNGATRLTIFANGTVEGSSHIVAGSNSYLAWNSRLLLYAPASDRLAFNGTSASFPALKSNSTALETKLADDSAYAPHAMQYLDVTDGVTAPASATGRARIYVDTADGDLKVIFADGTVKTIVTDT